MIPKIIHYCWFGGNEKSQLILNCIASWKRHLGDYEIIEWNEDNFDINICQYVKDALIAKKWAYVSDYVRAYALYHIGGIYLDTDVEIRNSLNEFLIHPAFSGFESKGFCFTALWGAERGHHWPKRIIDEYHFKEFSLETNTISVSNLLQNVYHIDPLRDELQVYNSDIFIYPSNYFCVDIPNFAVHHFEGSWLDNKHEVQWKEHVSSRYIEDRFFNKYKDLDTAIVRIQQEYNVTTKQLLVHIVKQATKKIKKLLYGF